MLNWHIQGHLSSRHTSYYYAYKGYTDFSFSNIPPIWRSIIMPTCWIDTYRGIYQVGRLLFFVFDFLSFFYLCIAWATSQISCTYKWVILTKWWYSFLSPKSCFWCDYMCDDLCFDMHAVLFVWYEMSLNATCSWFWLPLLIGVSRIMISGRCAWEHIGRRFLCGRQWSMARHLGTRRHTTAGTLHWRAQGQLKHVWDSTVHLRWLAYTDSNVWLLGPVWFVPWTLFQWYYHNW
jgi:hypothetical protein